MAHVSKGYNFVFEGGLNNSYYFETNQNMIYRVRFKPSGYLFEAHKNFANQAYEIVIAIVENRNDANKVPSDVLIKFTIFDIVSDFFKNKERIVVYICDTADLRHRARFRKFSTWFQDIKLSEFVKVDTSIDDPSGLIYLNAIILHRNNPYFLEIIDAFRKVTGGYAEEK